MGKGFFIVAVVSALATQAQAQVSETQQCVWACLHGPGNRNPANPAYHQCVAARCAEGGDQGQAAAPPVDARRQWVTGRTQSGIGYAGVDGALSGSGLYYFCGNGQSFLRVVGIDGGERGMIVDVDGRQFPLSFLPNDRNQPESRLSPTAPVIQALRSGNRVKVLSYEIGAIVDGTLAGSGRALAQVISSC